MLDRRRRIDVHPDRPRASAVQSGEVDVVEPLVIDLDVEAQVVARHHRPARLVLQRPAVVHAQRLRVLRTTGCGFIDALRRVVRLCCAVAATGTSRSTSPRTIVMRSDVRAVGSATTSGFGCDRLLRERVRATRHHEDRDQRELPHGSRVAIPTRAGQLRFYRVGVLTSRRACASAPECAFARTELRELRRADRPHRADRPRRTAGSGRSRAAAGTRARGRR